MITFERIVKRYPPDMTALTDVSADIGTGELVTIVGRFANIQAGQTLQMQGIWREHPKYGQQFQVNQYRETKPATLTGIEKYLGSGLTQIFHQYICFMF